MGRQSKPSDSPTGPYLSLEEVADLLGVHYQLIYRLVRSGDLPAIRLGRVYRVERGDLEAYLASRKTTGTGSATQPGRAFVCEGCGSHYSAQSSLTGGCAVCGAPLCADCERRAGIRFCKEHAPKGAEQEE